MRVLFDTSVLVAALVRPHPDHDRAVPWLRKAKAGEVDMIVSSHTLAELYAVLSTLPVSPRLSPEMAWRLIHENIESSATVTALSSSDYFGTIRDLKDRGLQGGVIYDALIFRSAVKAKAEALLTLNASDFERVKLQESIRIIRA